MIGFDVFKITFEGASHAEYVGATLSGFPSGVKVLNDSINEMMLRRKSLGGFATPRLEGDVPRFLSGIDSGVTDGNPIHVRIDNTNIKRGDYSDFRFTPRPSHADYTALMKYGSGFDMSGSGPFSGRMTAPICTLGAVAKAYLGSKGIDVFAYVASLGGVGIHSYKDASYSFESYKSRYNSKFQCVGFECDSDIELVLENARLSGDSLGGVIECAVHGLPVGLGGELGKGLEVKLASAVYTIPAVKGVEFGEGFGISHMKGSEANDAFFFDKQGVVRTQTNHSGGLNGGITNGMDLTMSVAFRPTPTIAMPQKTINLKEKVNTILEAKGRHDACICLRASAAVESMAAIAIADELVAMDTNNG